MLRRVNRGQGATPGNCKVPNAPEQNPCSNDDGQQTQVMPKRPTFQAVNMAAENDEIRNHHSDCARQQERKKNAS
jgi:hypothetical protein